MRRLFLFAVILTVMTIITGIVFAVNGPKTYQATGVVLSLANDLIVIKKGKKSQLEVIRNADTKVTGNLKQGATVIIQYKMIATTIEVKK